MDDPKSASKLIESQWSVWRTDDTGNSFLVREHLTRDEAERVVAEFTARGHKQTYWITSEVVQ